MTTTSTSMLQAALDYAARGTRVFPCNPSSDPKVSKRPLTKNGFKDATTDEATINAWWTWWPNALMASPTDDVFRVDQDRKEGGSDGVATWAALVAEHGGVPETQETTTPSTGRHSAFRNQEGFRSIPLDKLAPGIEIKGAGGYVILPPSCLDDGRAWQGNGCDKIADPPEWLCELIREYQGRRSKKAGATKPEPPKSKPQSAASAEFLALMMGDAGKGTSTRPEDCLPTNLADIDAALAVISSDGYWTWFRVGAALHDGFGDAGFGKFRDWSAKSSKYDKDGCKQKWVDVAKTTDIAVETIFWLADEADRGWRARLAQTRAASAAPRLIYPGATTAGAEETEKPWPVPVDLWGTFDPPALPLGLLPKTIEQYAITQGEMMGADPAGLAVAALVVCAAVIPDRIMLQPKKHDTSFTVSARIWAALIGDPSRKKSPILHQVTRKLKRIDARMFEEYAKAKARYDAMSSEERKATPPPQQVRLRLEDTTVEAAQEVFKNSPDGLLCLQDELGGWFGGMLLRAPRWHEGPRLLAPGVQRRQLHDQSRRSGVQSHSQSVGLRAGGHSTGPDTQSGRGDCRRRSAAATVHDHPAPGDDGEGRAHGSGGPAV
jgi:hypothetical protein